MQQTKCTAIVLAAGQGKRMGTKIQKQFLELCGKPILYYSLCAFEQSALIDEVILVTQKDLISYCKQEIVDKYKFMKVSTIAEGGAERYHSVYNGLQYIQEGVVFIHDGARPFVTEEIIQRAFKSVQKHGACVVGMPVKDTIKVADADQFAKETPDRTKLWMIQTPQVFEISLIKNAYLTLMREQYAQVTDDAMVVEQFTRRKVKLTEGSYENIKITTPEDLEIAEIFVNRKK